MCGAVQQSLCSEVSIWSIIIIIIIYYYNLQTHKHVGYQ